MTRLCIVALGFAFIVLGVHSAQAYLVGGALNLEKLVEESDVILKAKVVASQPLEEEWFQKYPGYRGYATELEVISAIKGEVPAGKVVFQHYGEAAGDMSPRMFMPQWYDLQKGRIYLIFAKKTENEGVLRQLWKFHKSKEDQGVIRCGDEQPVPKGTPVRAIIWSELNKLLKSKAPEDVVYAIRQLDEMSSVNLKHFEREQTLDVVARFIPNENGQIARTAIRTVGARSHYLGWGTPGGEDKNEEAAKYWRILAAVARGDRSPETRALAIAALGGVREPALYAHVQQWAEDPEPAVRQAAANLLADFPGDETRRLLRQLARDKERGVRICAARGIGFSRMADLLPVLEEMLKDEHIDIRTAAARGILAFGPDAARKLLEAHKNDPDFKSVFVNQLAAKDPEPYLDDLVEIIEKRMEPTNFWGGTIPHYRSWQHLFAYLKARPADAIRSGQFNKYLDTLESGQVHSSSMPRDIYAFYLDRGLNDRAKRFREKCKTAVRYDMEVYFNRVDASRAAKRPDR